MESPSYKVLPHWTENGKEYFWPRNAEEVPLDWGAHEIKPFYVPGLTLAIIEHSLLQIGQGKISKPKESLHLKLNDTEYRISILPPAATFTQFHISISPLGTGYRSAQVRQLVFEAIQFVSSLTFDNGLGTHLAIGTESYSAEFELHAKPKLFFRSHGIGNKSDKWEGIRDAGPYTSSLFHDRELDCLVIAPDRKKVTLKRWLGELKTGLPTLDSQNNFLSPFPSGWSTLFKFKDWNPHYCWIQGEVEWENLEQIILEEVSRKRNQGGKSFDLAMIVLPPNPEEASRLLAEAQTSLLELGIPCQKVELSQVNAPDRERATALRELALNAYVKVGGKPWLLPTDSSTDRLVIIGVGSTKLQEGVAGFCTLFSRDGTFRLGNASRKPSYESWISGMTSFVQDEIRRLVVEDNWKEGDRVELIFHLQEEAYFKEVPKLKARLKEGLLARYDSSISFLEIDYDHQDWIWDPSRKGRGLEGKGASVPKRGQALIMDQWSLLQLRELDHPEVEQPPLRLTLHPESESRDLSEFTRQVFRFSSVSWRQFENGDLPITLEYGNVLTETLFRIDQLGRIPQIEKALHNYPDLNTWFL